MYEGMILPTKQVFITVIDYFDGNVAFLKTAVKMLKGGSRDLVGSVFPFSVWSDTRLCQSMSTAGSSF